MQNKSTLTRRRFAAGFAMGSVAFALPMPALSLTADQSQQLIEAAQWDAPLLAELSQVMRDASICGLGQAAPNPVDSVLRFFPDEVSGS